MNSHAYSFIALSTLLAIHGTNVNHLRIMTKNIVLPPSTAKILLIRTDRLGDCLAITPAIRAARMYFKDARIDFLASSTNVEAVCTNPHLDTVYVLRQREPLSWPGLLWRLRRQKYDAALCLNSGSFTAALFTWISGAGTSFAFTEASARFPRCFDHVLFGTEKHATRSGLAFLNRLGIPSAGEALEFAIPESAGKNAALRFPRSGRKRLAVFIGNARKIHSRWPAEKFALLTESLLAKHEDLEIFLLCGRDELPLLVHFTPHERLATVNESLADTAAFLATCDALLTSSSGPWHLAAAVGTPTLGIISRHNYDFWRPLEGSHHFVVSEDNDMRAVEIEPVLNMVEDYLATK